MRGSTKALFLTSQAAVVGAVVVAVVTAAICVPVTIFARQLHSDSSCSTATTTTPSPPPTPTTTEPSLPPIPGDLLWPRPAAFSANTAVRDVDPYGVVLQQTKVVSSRLNRAIERFGSRFDLSGCRGDTGNLTVMVSIVTGDEVPIDRADESYTLDVPLTGPISITAQNSVGALRALETLSQLIVPKLHVPRIARNQTVCASLGTTAKGYEIPFVPWNITDQPAFGHRGVMLDTSRHYVPISSLQRTIDAMSMSKMNVFHWHVVDSQSFPFVSEALPHLSKGAYSDYEVYTKNDVIALVSYAADRGVRVIPEFDVPGHAYAWGIGDPSLTVCAGSLPWDLHCAEPPCGQLDISRNETVATVVKLITEVASWFPDPILHLGTDEVNRACYLDDPAFAKFLQTSGKSVDQALSDFILKLHGALQPLGKNPMHWEDIALSNGAPLNATTTIMQAWRGSGSVSELANRGFRVVNSDSTAFYLDCGTGQFLTRGGNSWCDPFKTWQTIYSRDPAAGVSPSHKNSVLGGEALLWTETTEAIGIDSKLWPRAAAAAEAWWSFSDSESKSIRDAAPRLALHSERLKDRGVSAAAIQPQWCLGRNVSDCY